MKIVRVKFLNLNSLKGEQEIRFDQAPFTESGLFAITGPTGAGKTTILDAITVALYGRVHRHNKDAAEIMSRHTAECYSEVEFEVKHKRYRAKWSLRRSRGKVNGALQPTKMELAEVPEGDLIGGHTLTSVQQAIVELCGLDYHQFLRSVVLSQGDFTKFLKADENERSDLLEKITDTGVYSDISKFTFERTKEEKEKLESLRAKLNDVELLSSDERTVHEERLRELSAKKKVIRDNQSLVGEKISWLNNLHSLKIKKAGLSARLAEQRNLLEENRADFHRVKLHNHAMEFRPALVEIRGFQLQSDQLQDDLKILSIQLPSLQEVSEKAVFELEQARKLESTARHELIDAKGLLDRVMHIDTELEGVENQVIRLKAAFEDSSNQVESLVQKEEEKAKEFRQLEEKIKGLQSWLAENKDDADLDTQLAIFRQYHKQLNSVFSLRESARREHAKYSDQHREDEIFLNKNQHHIDHLKKEIADVKAELDRLSNSLKNDFNGRIQEELELEASELPSLISVCEQQLKLSETYLMTQEKVRELQKKIGGEKDLYRELTLALGALRNKKEAAEANLNDLRQLVELQQRIQKYDADRQQLQQHQPCPLCGSLHHPYVVDHFQGELTRTEKKRNAQEKLVRELTDEFNLKSIDINGLQLTILTREEHLAQLSISINETSEQFSHNNNLLPKELDIESADTIKAVIQKKRRQFEALQKTIKAFRNIKQEQDHRQNLLVSKREVLVQVENQSEKVLVGLKTTTEQLLKLSGTINDLTDEQNTLASNLATLLSPYHIEYNFQGAAEIERALLEKSGRYLKAKNLLQQITLDHTRVATEIKSIGDRLAEKLPEKLKFEAEVSREKAKYQNLKARRLELFGDKSPSHEWERLDEQVKVARDLSDGAQNALQANQEQLKITEARYRERIVELEECKQKLSRSREELIKDLQIKGIDNIESLNQLFLGEDELKRLNDLEKNIENRIATLSGMLTTTESELVTEISKNYTTQSVEELKPLLDELDEIIANINQEIGRVGKILEDDNKLKIRFAEVANAIEVQHKEHARWFKLASLIGSADGKKFSRFAQGLTLARLTDLANRHLVKLSDRYRILKSKEKDLELQIVDRYQADVVRPMATLSGGESFLVSLALALGLSDLASKKVQINSLFIDEGFGTLDAETLDVAISALENLHAKGKSIGIISHVDALKERIGTQIQVSKHPGGSSRIKVFSYSKEYLEL